MNYMIDFDDGDNRVRFSADDPKGAVVSALKWENAEFDGDLEIVGIFERAMSAIDSLDDVVSN